MSNKYVQISVEQWQENILSNMDTIANALNIGCCKIIQRSEYKIKYLAISLLRSSIVDKSPLYLISGFHDKLWGHSNPIEEYLSVEAVSQNIYTNLSMPNMLSHQIDDHKAYFTEKMWMDETEKMHAAMIQCMPVIINRMPNIYIGITFSIGEYVDIQKKIERF